MCSAVAAVLSIHNLEYGVNYPHFPARLLKKREYQEKRITLAVASDFVVDYTLRCRKIQHCIRGGLLCFHHFM